MQRKLRPGSSNLKCGRSRKQPSAPGTASIVGENSARTRRARTMPAPGIVRARRVLAEFSPTMEAVPGAEGCFLLRPHFRLLEPGRSFLCIDGVRRTFDAYDPELRMDFEFDSWAFHGSKEQQG